MANYCDFFKDIPILNEKLRWENGEFYALPQDLADTFGWEEVISKTANLYHSLDPEIKDL